MSVKRLELWYDIILTPVLKYVQKHILMDSRLQQKEVFLPKRGIKLWYETSVLRAVLLSELNGTLTSWKHEADPLTTWNNLTDKLLLFRFEL